jgi:hypothetical protein
MKWNKNQDFKNLNNFIFKTKEHSFANEKSLESEMINAKHRYLKVLEQMKLAESVNLNNPRTRNRNNRGFNLLNSRNWKRNSTRRTPTRI